MDAGELYRKAFRMVLGGIVMFFVFTLTPLTWLFFRPDLLPLVLVAACFTFILAPLTAWLIIERVAADHTIKDNYSNYYHVWELTMLIKMGKQSMFYGSPVGWAVGIIYWCALKAVLRWPVLGLIIATVIS